MKKALFELEPALEFINSIARARAVEEVEFKVLKADDLLSPVQSDTEWFLLSRKNLAPIPVWMLDLLIDCLPEETSEDVKEARMLIAVERYTTPIVAVKLYLVDNLASIMYEAITKQKEELELSKKATEEWCLGKGEGTDE